MDLSTKINIVLCLLSFILAAISVITVVITLRQNHKMIENATRPYVVVYNDLVNGAGTPIQFLVIKNFGQTAATIDSLVITPKVDVQYSDELFKYMDGQIIAPGQSYSTAFKLFDSSITLHVSIEYSSGNKKYTDVFNISQKAISDHVHSKVKSNNLDHALEIMSGCFQDFLRSKL